jgi:hypothetical protein
MTIDVDGNGILGDDDDCVFGATIDREDITITPSGGSQLRVCQGQCFGFGFVDSSSAGVSIEDCNWGSLSPGGPFVPACLEAGTSVPSSSSFCSSSTPSLSGGAGQGGVLPEFTAARLFYPFFGGQIIPNPGAGFLCNAGGPAVQITTISGRIVVTNFTFLGSPPTHACVKVPFEQLSEAKVLLDACVPLNANGDIDLGVDDGDLFATIPLSGPLPACGAGRTAAPSVTDLGLVILALGLLGFGAWTLGRRSGFARSLPML